MKMSIIIILISIFIPQNTLYAGTWEETVKKYNTRNVPLGSSKDDPRKNNYTIIHAQPATKNRDKTVPRNIQEKQNHLRKRLTWR